MKRSDLNQTMRAINMIRKEKTPPTATYCIMLALASLDNKPTGIGEIMKILDEQHFGGGSMERMVDKGFLTLHKQGRDHLYTLTAAGYEVVRRLVAGELPPTPQKLRHAAIKKLAAQVS